MNKNNEQIINQCYICDMTEDEDVDFYNHKIILVKDDEWFQTGEICERCYRGSFAYGILCCADDCLNCIGLEYIEYDDDGDNYLSLRVKNDLCNNCKYKKNYCEEIIDEPLPPVLNDLVLEYLF